MGAAIAKEDNLRRDLVSEFFGTALMVFIGCGSIISSYTVSEGLPLANSTSNLISVSLAFGLAVAIALTLTKDVSGGFCNPAVTFSLLCTGGLSTARAALYIVAQLLGAIIGSFVLWGCTSELSIDDHPPLNLGGNFLNNMLKDSNGFIFEFVSTLILITVIFQTAVYNKNKNSNLIIGLTVSALHFIVFPFTGCGINPARTFGPAIINSFSGKDSWGSDWWIYYLGPIFGSILGASISTILFGEDNKKSSDAAPASVELTETKTPVASV